MTFEPGHPKRGGKPKGYRAPSTLARERGRARALRNADITAERVMLELIRQACGDRSACWKDGKLLPFDQWPVDTLALLEGFEIVIKNAAAGDGHTDTVHKVHMAKRFPALEALAKHFGLVTERLELSGDIMTVLQAARDRHAKTKERA